MAWLHKAAEAGQDCAQYALGKLYSQGNAVEKDIPKALAFFTQAAKQGNDYAAYALGKLLLERGDTGEGIRWLKQAADAGNQFARYRLGKIYLMGEAAPKDVDAAIAYLTASAGQGNQYAQYTLGKLYLLGREVERDRDTAMRWLSLSAAQGNTYAQYFIDHMDDFRGTPAASAVLRMLHHMGSIFRDNSTADGIHVGMQIDKKLRRKMKQKKIAMGHKADDHEQEQKYIMKQ
jgi:TPR repeat protein